MTDAAYTPSMDGILKGYVDGAGSGWLRDVRRENFTAALAAFEQSIRTQIAAEIRAAEVTHTPDGDHGLHYYTCSYCIGRRMGIRAAAALAERGQG